jgi:hypothetical protein
VGQEEQAEAIAIGAGYYDQAHLVAEVRAVARVTPSGGASGGTS